MSGERRTSPPEFLVDIRLPPYLQQHQQQQQQAMQAQFHQQHPGPSTSQGNANQKPEWKRYKQYTRNDILSAIQCVKNGMSALQASRKFGVPSRTLYDKVKKLGITTGTPRNRASVKRERLDSAGPSTAAFPFGSLSGAAGAFGFLPNPDNQQSQTQTQSQSQEFSQEELNHHHHANVHAASLLDPAFLQKALEARGEDGIALHTMALAAAAHAQMNGMSRTSPQAGGSISPNSLSNYMSRSIEAEMNRERERNRTNGKHTAIKLEPVDHSEDEMETSERAENLSLSKRDSPPSTISPPPIVRTPPFTPNVVQSRGVIMPPMRYSSPRSHASSTTPPSVEQPLPLALTLEKSELKQSLADQLPIALTPTNAANYDE